MSEPEDSMELVLQDETTDEELETALAEIYEEDPIDHLTEQQVHAALMLALSPERGLKDIADSVGKSVSTLRNWKRDPYFDKYVKQQMVLYSREARTNHVEKTMFLHDKLFGEVADRFGKPAKTEQQLQAVLGENYTQNDKRRYLARFAHNASFTEIMRAFGQIDQQLRLDNGEATARVEQKEFVDQTRSRYEQRMIKRRKFKDFREDNPDVFEFDHIIDVSPMSSDEKPASVETIEETEEIHVVMSEFAMED